MKNFLKVVVLAGVLLCSCSGTPRDDEHDSHGHMRGDTLTHKDSVSHSSSAHNMPMNMDGMSAQMMKQLEDKTGDDFDRMFLPLMTMHHQGAVQMAEEALKKSHRNDIRRLSQNIISAQKSEMSQMENWFKNWYPNEIFSANDHGMNSHMMQMLSGKSAADFDMEYLRLMIMHHRDGVVMSKPALTKARHPEVKKLAQRIITDQEREINEMQKMQLEIASTAQ
ncbi:MAG TPA: DUF305 domain-containing protein [Patescibacteria group bacterium]|nr:DUF305 domain-containing protein [Patescibacteria group bacterium]